MRTQQLSFDEIQPGDLLWLKSGGPATTLERKFENVDGEFMCIVVWFNDSDELKTETLRVTSLTDTEPFAE